MFLITGCSGLDEIVELNNDEIIQPKVSMQIYPNPFNPSTTISFELTAKDAENAKIKIYNLKGQKIRIFSIFNNQSSIIWNGTNENDQHVSSGIYYYKLIVNNKVINTKKMVLMK